MCINVNARPHPIVLSLKGNLQGGPYKNILIQRMRTYTWQATVTGHARSKWTRPMYTSWTQRVNVVPLLVTAVSQAFRTAETMRLLASVISTCWPYMLYSWNCSRTNVTSIQKFYRASLFPDSRRVVGTRADRNYRKCFCCTLYGEVTPTENIIVRISPRSCVLNKRNSRSTSNDPCADSVTEGFKL